MTPGDILTSSGKYPARCLDCPPTMDMLHDAQVLAQRVSNLWQSYSSTMMDYCPEPVVSSGYRPPEVNAETPGAAKDSNHMLCRAVDIADPDGRFTDWCSKNMDLMAHFELWQEDPRWTKGWVHLQSVPPKSQHRIFIPFKGPPPA